MQNIELQAIQNYEQNLVFLEEKFPEIFKKVSLLNSAIENGQYKEKYALEYVNEGFDVLELESANYLYSKDTTQVSKDLSKRVTFSKNSYSFEGFQMYHNFENYQNHDDKGLGLMGVYPIMSYYLDTIQENQEMKKIDKFIFIGIGLGIHIDSIDTKIKAKEYLIIEDDLELFKLSLFTTPYYKIFQGKDLIFSIVDNDTVFATKMRQFLEESFFLNRYLKYSYFPAHSDNKIKIIQNVLSSQSFVNFPYATLQSKILRPLSYLKENYKNLHITKEFKTQIFQEYPTLVLASGPSLLKNIEWIKTNQNKFIIIAVASSLKILHKYDIHPDIVTQTDGFDISTAILEGFDASEFLKDTIGILGSFTNKQMRETFQKENVYLLEDTTSYINNNTTVNGACIGSSTLYYATLLKSKEIYILGLDLALNEDGTTHSKGHVTSKTVVNTDTTLQSEMEFRGTTLITKGNFSQNVTTIPLFNISIEDIYNKLPTLITEEQTIYNLSDGAYLNTTTPKEVSSIETDTLTQINKQNLFPLLKNNFDEQQTYFTQEDRLSLKIKLEYIKELKEAIYTYKNNTSHTNIDTYSYHLFGLVNDLCTGRGREKQNISEVYFSFFSYTLPIILDLFNTKELKNSKRHIKKIDKLLVSELINIANKFEEEIEVFFKI